MKTTIGVRARLIIPALTSAALLSGCAHNSLNGVSPAMRGDPYSRLAEELSKGKGLLINRKVAILPFSYPDSEASIDGSVIAERLITRITNRRELEVVERSQLEKVLTELKLQNSGIVDEQSVKGLGKVLGTGALVTGTITRRKDGLLEVNARLIDTETAGIIIAAVENVSPDWETSPTANDSQPQQAIVQPRTVADAPYRQTTLPSLANAKITTFAGNGTPGSSGEGGQARNAQITLPFDIALNGSGDVYMALYGDGLVRKVTARTSQIHTVAGTGASDFNGDWIKATSANLWGLTGIALNSTGDIFITEAWGQRVRKINSRTGLISTVAGNGRIGYSGDGGPALKASLHSPFCVRQLSNGDIYITDNQNHRVRMVKQLYSSITTSAGGARQQPDAELNEPGCFAQDLDGGLLFTDVKNHRIMKIDPATGHLSTVLSWSSGEASGWLGMVTYLAVDGAGRIYLSDTLNNRVIRWTPADNNFVLVAGNGKPGYSGDGGPAAEAQLFEPRGLALDASGNLYIADTKNNRIRKVWLPKNRPS